MPEETKATTPESTTTDPKATTETPPKQEEKAPVTFTAEQQSVLDKLIGDARKDGKTIAERAATDAKAQADADRLRVEQEAKGEFDKVKQSLIEERDAVKTDKNEMAAKVASYEKLALKRVEAVKAGIPAEALDDFPDDADALEQLTWLEGRAALLAKLIPAGAATNGARVPATPQSQGVTKSEYERAVEQMRGRISI